MDKESRFKNFDSIVITNNQIDKCLNIQLTNLSENINIRNLLQYLKNNGWCNYKFNEYSIKKQDNINLPTLVILSYTPPTTTIFK
jgi:hypothetical protein